MKNIYVRGHDVNAYQRRGGEGRGGAQLIACLESFRQGPGISYPSAQPHNAGTKHNRGSTDEAKQIGGGQGSDTDDILEDDDI